MSRTIRKPTGQVPESEDPGSAAGMRTYRLLMSHAMQLVSQERSPSVAELAKAAGVSRATAYRYFPSRSKLITAVVGEGLATVRSFESSATDGVERMHELFKMTFPIFVQYEPHMRAALQLSLEHHALERSGVLDEEPFRRGHRRLILARTMAPLRKQLGAAKLDRLMKAMSLIYGIEPYVILKDIWGSNDSEVAQIALWVVDALLSASLRDAAGAGRPAGGTTVKRKSITTSKTTGKRTSLTKRL